MTLPRSPRSAHSLAAAVLLLTSVAATGCASGGDAGRDTSGAASSGASTASSSTAGSGTAAPSSAAATAGAGAAALPGNEETLALRDAFMEAAGLQGKPAIKAQAVTEYQVLRQQEAAGLADPEAAQAAGAVGGEQCLQAQAEALTAAAESGGTAVTYQGARSTLPPTGEAAEAGGDTPPDAGLVVQNFPDEAAAQKVKDAMDATMKACQEDTDYSAAFETTAETGDGDEVEVTRSASADAGALPGTAASVWDGTRLVTVQLTDVEDVETPSVAETAELATELRDAARESFGEPGA